MRAAIVTAVGGKFTPEEVDIDEAIGREVLVDIRASGLCHSDLHVVEMGHTISFPSVRGHEIAGVIVAVGPDVRDLAEGDHVVGCLVPWCGECEPCLAGHKTMCRRPAATLRGAGERPRLSRQGAKVTQGNGMAGFAAQVLTHENQLTVIDPTMPFAQAAVIGCSVVTGIGAVEHVAKVCAGETIVVFGCGGVGLNIINGAAIAGAAEIIAVDVVDAKLDWATRFGATHVVNSGRDDPAAAICEIASSGADHAFEVVGISVTQQQAWSCLGVGGRAYLMGMSAPGTELVIDTSESHRMQKTVEQVYLGATDPRRDIPRYVELYQSGALLLDELVTDTISIDEMNEAYAALVRGEILRSVITEF